MVKIIQVHCIVIALYGTYKQLYATVHVQASLVINNGIQNQKV